VPGGMLPGQLGAGQEDESPLGLLAFTLGTLRDQKVLGGGAL
jgi:hypothetical protein